MWSPSLRDPAYLQRFDELRAALNARLERQDTYVERSGQ
jgi:hypothetical protein